MTLENSLDGSSFRPYSCGPATRSGAQAADRESRRLRATDGDLHGVAATIDSSDSAPATPAAYRGAPPTHLSTFVGRERELAELEALVAEARLVTLTGPGGSGKTRLALEFVARVRDRLPDDAFFVDFAPITDPDLMPSTIAASLGIRVDPRRPRSTRLSIASPSGACYSSSTTWSSCQTWRPSSPTCSAAVRISAFWPRVARIFISAASASTQSNL